MKVENMSRNLLRFNYELVALTFASSTLLYALYALLLYFINMIRRVAFIHVKLGC